MYKYCFYDLKVHFWWPNKCLFSYRQRWNTLYHVVYNFKYLNHFECVSTQYFTINLMNLVENFDPLHDNNQNSSLERVPVMPKWERQLGQQQHSHKQERAACTGGRRRCCICPTSTENRKERDGRFEDFKQKYSRLRCLFRVKGLVIGFYLGWSGHTLLIRKI